MKKKSKLKILTLDKSYTVKDSPFYRLRSKRKLALLLNSTLASLNSLSVDAGNYSEFEDLSKSGKVRKIQCPVDGLDRTHTRIASLLCRVDTPAYLHSGKKKHSNITNAKCHLGSSNLMATDIKSFFPSTKKKMIFSLFNKIFECSPDVANQLAELCTIHGHIPTGSRISMPLAYWANIRMFEELHALSLKHNIIMTVYVDDLTFSGDNVNPLFRNIVKKIISKHEQIMHPKKTMMYSSNQAKLITGVVVLKDQLLVRNAQHNLLFSDIECWKQIKESPLAIDAGLTSKLLGRLYSMGYIEPRFRAKAMSVKAAIQKCV